MLESTDAMLSAYWRLAQKHNISNIPDLMVLVFSRTVASGRPCRSIATFTDIILDGLILKASSLRHCSDDLDLPRYVGTIEIDGQHVWFSFRNGICDEWAAVRPDGWREHFDAAPFVDR